MNVSLYCPIYVQNKQIVLLSVKHTYKRVGLLEYLLRLGFMRLVELGRRTGFCEMVNCIFVRSLHAEISSMSSVGL